MCGPLVALLGKHTDRIYYFWGRLTGFSLAGWFAGAMGALFHTEAIAQWLSAVFTLLLGVLICSMCLLQKSSILLGFWKHLTRVLAPVNTVITKLALQGGKSGFFLFGLSTLLLPCGQSLTVFAACALYGDAWVGGFNGMMFALLTSPSLWCALYTQQLLNQFYPKLQSIGTVYMLAVGIMALCRSFASFGWIDHVSLNLPMLHSVHLALF